MPASKLLFAITSGDDARVAQARALLLEYAQTLGVDLSFQNFERELADFPSSYLPPDGALLIATVDERLAGGLTRAILTEERAGVVNAYRGAAMGPILFSSSERGRSVRQSTARPFR